MRWLHRYISSAKFASTKFKISELFFLFGARDDLLKFFHIDDCNIPAYLLEGLIFDFVLIWKMMLVYRIYKVLIIIDQRSIDRRFIIIWFKCNVLIYRELPTYSQNYILNDTIFCIQMHQRFNKTPWIEYISHIINNIHSELTI